MGRKGKQAKLAQQAQKAGGSGGDGGGQNEGGVSFAWLMAVHPDGKTSATAFGTDLRVYDARTNARAELDFDPEGNAAHTENIQALEFDPSGDLMATAGDDKLVRLWDVKGWKCRWSLRAPKKVSSAAFSGDGAWLAFSDKYGDVYVVPTGTDAAPEPSLLLGHFCSIITSLAFSPDSSVLASADRDERIRVNVFPAQPADGAHEIMSYCLGHESFVTDVCFLPAGSAGGAGEQLLVSGGGDGTMRLWQASSGALLDTCQVGSSGGKDPTPVVALAGCAKSGAVAAILQGETEIVILKARDGHSLEVAQRLALPGLQLPSAVRFDSSGGMWAFGMDEGGKTCVAQAWSEGGELRAGGQPEGGSGLRGTLGGAEVQLWGKEGSHKDVVATQVRSDWNKRKYTEEDLNNRKRHRNDIKS